MGVTCADVESLIGEGVPGRGVHCLRSACVPCPCLFPIVRPTLLAMALWFSGSAVVPQLPAEWGLSGGEQSWMIADPGRWSTGKSSPEMRPGVSPLGHRARLHGSA